jgi:hypothetical protein
MASPLHTPRVNNNDDVVRLIRLLVQPGDPVRSGDIVAEVETDKASRFPTTRRRRRPVRPRPTGRPSRRRSCWRSTGFASRTFPPAAIA